MSEDAKICRKQWNMEEISALIDALREHTNLWCPKDKNYKNRMRKMDSYKEIAQLFATNWTEVERKLKNVISQYQRERRNYKKFKTSGAGQHFTSKWFGYNAMSFMHDRNKPRKGVRIGGGYEESESSNDDPQTQTQNYLHIQFDLEDERERHEPPLQTERLLMQKASTSHVPKIVHCENDDTNPKITMKKKSHRNMEQDNESSQVFQMMKSMYEKRERDEYDVFGEMVAHNIRSLKTEYTKITVQQKISNLLFDARRCHLPQSNAQSFTPVSSSSPSPTLSGNSTLTTRSGPEVQTIAINEAVNNFDQIQQGE